MPAELEAGVEIVLYDVTEEMSQHMLTEIDKLPALQIGDFVLQLELDEPQEPVNEKARCELRETPEIVKPAIEKLKTLLQEDKELTIPNNNDAWLIRFLRPCKYYPDSAYELIKHYYSFKIKHSDIYEGLLPSKEQNVFNQNIITVLPLRDQLGRRIMIMELGKKWNYKKCTLDEVFKCCVLFLEVAMLEPVTQICGAVVILDMDGLSMQQVWQFTPTFAKRILDWLQDSIPIRVKGLYVVNQPYIFNMVFQLFKPFLKEKLRSRIKFIGNDRKLLHQLISPKGLPASYGGSVAVPVVTGQQWYELLLMCDKEFAAINSYGYKKK